MSRPQAVAAWVALAAALGVAVWWPRYEAKLPLTCPDGGRLAVGATGVVTCEATGMPLPVGQSVMLGQKFDCNAVSAEELALVPGIGLSLAQALVSGRDGGFRTWDEVDSVPGVGTARLAALQHACEIGVLDSGVW
jgi:competence protein ComEA